jgi:hypothetical protein
MIWTFDPLAHTLSHAGTTPWSCEAHGEAIPMPEGPVEAGTYTLSTPEFNEPDEAEDLTSMGPYFIPVNNIPGHSAVGIHGGGSAAPHPLAARQGFYPTENCIRLQNIDLYHVVLNVAEGDTLVWK